jgi:3-methyladenine DNA glycosylase/8-oxoguanine DNA glycosylase
MSEKKTLKTRAARLVKGLRRLYPNAECALNHTSPLELMVATILSAQCTDERVNIVTATLFRKYRNAADYLSVPVGELERDIQSINFFRNKARSIQGACRKLIDQYAGEVPQTLEELIEQDGQCHPRHSLWYLLRHRRRHPRLAPLPAAWFDDQQDSREDRGRSAWDHPAP